MNFAMVRKSFLAFDKVSELDQTGILYQTESFLIACMSLVHKLDKPWSRQWPSFTNTRKELIEMCSPIGHNNTKHFFVPNQEPAPLEFLEMVRWQSVPRGSFARNENFRAVFSPDPNDCPWVSEDAATATATATKRRYFYATNGNHYLFSMSLFHIYMSFFDDNN